MGCEYQNCYIVEDRDFFMDVTEYDAILFNSIDVSIHDKLPDVRSSHQIYVFVSLESPINYPIDNNFNYFFNYTWTYRMNSDIYFPYFVTRDKRGRVIAPKVDVKWMDINDMAPISKSLKRKLDKKHIAVSWFVTNCKSVQRIHYLRSLRQALQQYNHNVDVYGFCDANKVCLKDHMDDCLALIESDYYFYLSFENSFAEDYVTEKLMNALDRYAVPVVLGGANYSRFMPDGIYLNANNLTGEQLAKKIYEALEDKEIYYNYFKWHNHYSYHTISESADTDPLCTFCAFLNGAKKRTKQVYARFTYWWNGYNMSNDEGDVIVYFNTSRNVYETVVRMGSHITNINDTITFKPVIVHEPSIIQSIGEFFGKVFGYYSD